MNRPLLWKIWVQSKTWKVRPSELLGITDEYQAWCVDDAVYEFGTACEATVDEAKANKKGTAAQKNGAGENALRRMLGVKQKFRDISELINKRG